MNAEFILDYEMKILEEMKENSGGDYWLNFLLKRKFLISASKWQDKW